MWEQPPSSFLDSPGLLALAVLAQTNDRVSVLKQVAARIDQIENKTIQQNVTASVDILAGLLLEKAAIRKILRKELMKESVTYQAIIEEGREEGREEGEHLLTLKMLSLKFGSLPETVTAQVSQLPSAQLPMLGLAMLNFESLADLTRWMQNQNS